MDRCFSIGLLISLLCIFDALPHLFLQTFRIGDDHLVNVLLGENQQPCPGTFDTDFKVIVIIFVQRQLLRPKEVDDLIQTAVLADEAGGNRFVTVHEQLIARIVVDVLELPALLFIERRNNRVFIDAD